ncbi:MAG: outer membrane lipoprotein-sorting protein [Gammaproteobacteria bacterium]|nr:outer membrane lipoprotein-sorting protein [Gammaproteobacteria bacterium]
MKLVQMFWAAAATLVVGSAQAMPDLEGKSPLEAGTELAEYAETVHAGWTSSKSEGRMVLRDAQGSENTQKLKTWLLESEGGKDGGRSFIVYDEKGTALLTHMKRTKSDNQWVWIPGLKRKMRVKAANITGAFIGSEFAIEDLRSQYPEKYEITLLGEEEYEGKMCWKLQRVPLVKETGYSKHIVWMDQKEFLFLKTEFYDKKGDLIKTLTTHDWQQYNDVFWRPNRSSMVNHQTGRSSDMLMDDIELGIKLKKSSFEAGRGLMREAK